jgi:hypothetical protein
MTNLLASGWGWDLLLRGAVGGVLVFHVVHLALPGPRPAVRAALAVFTVSLIAYLFCQRAELLFGHWAGDPGAVRQQHCVVVDCCARPVR